MGGSEVAVPQHVQLCRSGGAGAAGHRLRTIRTVVDEALARLEDDLATLYAPIGRRSIPPEQL